MIRRTFVVLVFVASSCVLYSTQNTHGNSPGAPRVDPPRMRGGEHAIVDEEEERYVPAAFNIDDGTSNGNGLHNGHAIEMLAPVEVSEYGWNDASRGVAELAQGGTASVENRRPSGAQELADRPTGDLIQCGHLQIDPRHAVCCDGLVYRKTKEQDAGKCCGSVAYDDRHFTCCQGRAIVRRNGQLPLCCGDYTRDTLPDQCRPGYQNDTSGLGSTCCRSADTGAWKCCIRGQGCCDRDSGTAIDVPGFRPACCHLANEDLTAQCCATTYEKVRVLPDCCSGGRLVPVCCKKRDSVAIKCCPGTIGYCCGSGEIETRLTEFPPPAILHSTRAPIQPPRATHPPRPSYTDSPTRYPPISYVPEPISGRPPARTYPPYPTQPPFPQYTTRFPGAEYSPAVSGAPRPSCCKSRIPQRPCCSKTRGQQCCRSSSSSSSSSSPSSSSMPRCCFIIYFNVTCCRNHMQQPQQPQLTAGSQHGGGNGGVSGGVQRHPVDVHPVSQAPQTNGHHQAGQHPWLNGRNPEDHGRQRGTVAHNCCGLDSSEAVVCCLDGYKETGRLPSCCISSPDSRRDIQSDQPHPPAPSDHHHHQKQQQQQHRNDTGTEVGRCNGESFDAEEHICCGDRLRQRIGVRPACCLSVAYDSLLYKCCDGKVRLSCSSEYKPKKSLWGVHV